MKRIHFCTTVAILGLLILGTAQPANAGGLPDLTVTEAFSEFSNSQWFLRYSIKNIGTAHSEAFRVTIKDRAGILKETFMIANIAPGATFRLRHSTGVCEFYRKIAVDTTSIVVESNEGNNTRVYENFC
jgi:subtilase family serine protease